MEACNGKTYRRIVGEIDRLLDKPLAEGAAAHYLSPVIVLDGPGEDFAG